MRNLFGLAACAGVILGSLLIQSANAQEAPDGKLSGKTSTTGQVREAPDVRPAVPRGAAKPAVVDGKVIGRDPDPRVREQLKQDSKSPGGLGAGQ